MRYLFFRNDDIRQTLDDSLVELTNLFIKNKIPISHAVEPANVSPEVVNWLVKIKDKHPELIEIIQHGYMHKLNYCETIGVKLRKGEFGGDRTYDEQSEDILRGKELMNKYFADKWFHAFTFPYGSRNKASIKAISDNGFKVVNGSMGVGFKHSMFYFLGQLLRREIFLNHKISWNLRYKTGTKLFQIDTSISLIRKFFDEDVNAEFYTLTDLKRITERYLQHKPNIGYILHHRYHNTKEKISLVKDLLNWLQSIPNVQFSTMEDIYNKFA